MAGAVIGGLLVSTLLLLLFVPAFFAMMDDLGSLAKGLWGRFTVDKDSREEIGDGGAHRCGAWTRVGGATAGMRFGGLVAVMLCECSGCKSRSC
jgi:hypothetical protein